MCFCLWSSHTWLLQCIFYFHFSLCMFPFIILLVHFLDMQLIAQAGIGHQMTSLMVKEASDWFDRFFRK